MARRLGWRINHCLWPDPSLYNVQYMSSSCNTRERRGKGTDPKGWYQKHSYDSSRGLGGFPVLLSGLPHALDRTIDINPGRGVLIIGLLLMLRGFGMPTLASRWDTSDSKEGVASSASTSPASNPLTSPNMCRQTSKLDAVALSMGWGAWFDSTLPQASSLLVPIALHRLG